MNMREKAVCSKRASLRLAASTTACRHEALGKIADALEQRAAAIIRANENDLHLARESGLAAPLLSRLKLDAKKLEGIVEGVRSLLSLPDPIGRVLRATELDEGLSLYQVSCPIGVVGVIFESRPDALVQISTLCLKSGNGVLLKGGREALQTNKILYEIIRDASAAALVPDGWMQLLETRSEVADMLGMDDCIDLLVPRGSNAFVQYVMRNSNTPVLGHASGVCHLYIDAEADVSMAVALAVDSKCQYVSVCNACETILVHTRCAEEILPMLFAALHEQRVTVKGCARTRAIVACEAAGAEDWSDEYLDDTVAIKVVDSMDVAMDHINTYGSGHTDAIVTKDADRAETFMALVDSGNVFWNCSTRFSDGFRYGLGAEVGVSTSKIHARGPVGLEGLMIYKWKLYGAGHIVAPYAERKRVFTHRPLL